MRNEPPRGERLLTPVPIEAPPPRTDGRVNPWIEISAWILAFAILLAAQCAPATSGMEWTPASGAPRDDVSAPR